MKPPKSFAQAETVEVAGVPPSVPDAVAAVFRSRLDKLVRDLVADQHLNQLDVHLSYGMEIAAQKRGTETGIAKDRPLSKYMCSEPLFSNEFLVVSAEVREHLESAIQIIELRSLLFETWGLNQIEPNPRSALNFHGPPGTGKTVAAHSVASAMGRKILCASYADIESMYHGEGPKNVVELFKTAESINAVLFIDEADSLLSKRLTSVTQGSEQAINSMRSQLLICLDNFKGIVIFATNLVTNYDSAFDTRVRHIHFPPPDREARIRLWKKHLPEQLPQEGVRIEELADASNGMVGREIKMAVIDAAVHSARTGKNNVSHLSLVSALEGIIKSREQKEPAMKTSH